MPLLSNSIFLRYTLRVLFAGSLFAGYRGLCFAPSATGLAQERRSLETVCAKCHDLQMVTDTPRSYDDWRDTVQTMVDRGASGSDQQFADVMDYLHRTMTTINVNTAPAEELEIVLNVPEETAKAVIARRSARKFIDLSDFKSVLGANGSIVNTRSRLIFFR